MSSWIAIFALCALSLVVVLMPLWSRRADRKLGFGIETNDISKQWEAEKDRLLQEQHDLDLALLEGRISKDAHDDEREQVVKDAERALSRLRDARSIAEKEKERPKRKPRVYHFAGSLLAGFVILATGMVTFYLNGQDVVRQIAPKIATKSPDKQPTQADIAKMVEGLEQRVKAGSSSQKEQLMLARSFLVLGRRVDAIELYNKIHTADEKNIQAVMALGELYFTSKDKVEQTQALEFFEKVLALSPDKPEALWYKSLALVRERRLGEARTVLQRLKDVAPDNKQAQAAVSQLLTELDKNQRSAAEQEKK